MTHVDADTLDALVRAWALSKGNVEREARRAMVLDALEERGGGDLVWRGQYLCCGRYSLARVQPMLHPTGFRWEVFSSVITDGRRGVRGTKEAARAACEALLLKRTM